MKRVLLVTLFDETNIGNRLQNYALQTVLEKYGANVTTLDNYYTNRFSKKTQMKYAVKSLLSRLGYRKYQSECREYRRISRIRKSVLTFNKRNLSNVKRISNAEAFTHDWSDYDLAVAGSDQVWHKWRADPDELPFYYLEFMPRDKRTAYAASFGFETFPEQDIEQHRHGLSEMGHISCREERGCGLVKELVDRDVPRVLDPTLLLSANEWRAIEAQSALPAKQTGPYAFVFFLGNIPEEYRAYMESVKQELGIKHLVYFNDKSIKHCGPCEFLQLIDQAAYVFTDSFHCTAFSTLFSKQFTAFRRIEPGFEKMFGRIEDLLSGTDKLSAIYGGTSQTAKNDFDELRDNSLRYIEKILGVTRES